MKTLSELVKDNIFQEITYGQKEYENKYLLDKGKIPLISSKGTDNGCYGFYDVKPNIEPPFITVARTGSVGEAFVQDVPCCPESDCLILKTTKPVDIEYLYYVAATVRKQKWRYNYGRKITPMRLRRVSVLEPDEFKAKVLYDKMMKELYPNRNSTQHNAFNANLKPILLTEFFTLERGQFHALDKLDDGIYPTVSRTSWDNGIDGFYDKPTWATIYPKLTLTVSTVSGQAFLQIVSFIATDNVVICVPKKAYKTTTLLYIQGAINKVKWRYSYGRQCYKGLFEKTIVYLPLKDNGDLDEDYMQRIVENEPYWKAFKDLTS